MIGNRADNRISDRIPGHGDEKRHSSEAALQANHTRVVEKYKGPKRDILDRERKYTGCIKEFGEKRMANNFDPRFNNSSA